MSARWARRGWRERALCHRRFVAPAVRREQQDRLDEINRRAAARSASDANPPTSGVERGTAPTSSPSPG